MLYSTYWKLIGSTTTSIPLSITAPPKLKNQSRPVIPVMRRTDPDVEFTLLSENRTNQLLSGTYNLMIFLVPSRAKKADKAVMVTTIVVHEGMHNAYSMQMLAVCKC